MGIDCRSADRSVLLERGSAVVEGIAAIAIVFMLFTVAAQLAVAMLAHQTAEAIVASAARAASLGQGPSNASLVADLVATVPGAREIDAGVDATDSLARAWAHFDFLPPGPLFRRFRFRVEAEVPVVVDP